MGNNNVASDFIYKREDVPLFETLYGENLISLGGLEAVDNMFSDIELKNKNILDIGFGLGGVAFYLAKKYQCAVAGVEINTWMVEYAETHAPKEIAHLLKFRTYNQGGEVPFDDASFDIVYSKGVLNHVKDKNDLFLQIHRVLKPQGLFVIADWISPNSVGSDSGPLAHETQASYKIILEKTGFQNIRFRDDSHIFLKYVKRFLENLIKNQGLIEKNFGTEIFSIIEADHQKLIKDIQHQEKCAVRIIASVYDNH